MAEAKEEDDMLQYETTVEALQNKVCSLQSLNEKILSLTDAKSTPDEMLESEEYTFDLEVKLRKFQQYLLQKSTSKDAQVVPTQRCEAQPQENQSRNENSSNSLKLPIILPRPVNNVVPSAGAYQNRKQPDYAVHSIPVVNNAPYLAQQLLTQATPAASLTYKLPRYKYHAIEKHAMGNSAIILPRPDVLLGVGKATIEMCTHSRTRNGRRKTTTGEAWSGVISPKKG
ncbi:hypothetical protein DPMN_003966 [Dreissena polymorpha]|uniref:Uncharacterized protein n=1 Tax=Dreissena polymorpha TaxID=45954 RepID=A0A9D4MQD0_DREPO|nr:hypothetical protein DPMN_003966 [Dreissena polymorpha]